MPKRILEIQCKFCGKTFVAQRSTAKYCGANCRKAYSRIGDKLHNYAEIAAGHLWAISRLIDKHPDWRWSGHEYFEFVIQEATELWLHNRGKLEEKN